MDSEVKVKVLIAKMGIDVHDVGATIVTKLLRDAGMEVIYLGLFNMADSIAKASVDEDVNIVGISFQDAMYTKHIADLMTSLREANSKAQVVVGGLIIKHDIAKLKEMGVAEVFLTGAAGDDIVGSIKRVVSGAHDTNAS